jgi:hypothetical protein
MQLTKVSKCLPSIGLVTPSATIPEVWTYQMVTLCSFKDSSTKNICYRICLVLMMPPPLVTILMTDVLSWYISGISMSELVIKEINSWNNSINPRLSDNATSSASVRLLPTHFCFWMCKILLLHLQISQHPQGTLLCCHFKSLQ